MRSIGDVLRVVPGASIGQGEGHRDQITLRGLDAGLQDVTVAARLGLDEDCRCRLYDAVQRRVGRADEDGL